MNDMMRNQVRLFVLVILAFLPAVGLYLYANGILRERELRQSQQELIQFAHVAAVEYQRLIDESLGEGVGTGFSGRPGAGLGALEPDR